MTWLPLRVIKPELEVEILRNLFGAEDERSSQPRNKVQIKITSYFIYFTLVEIGPCPGTKVKMESFKVRLLIEIWPPGVGTLDDPEKQSWSGRQGKAWQRFCSTMRSS